MINSQVQQPTDLIVAGAGPAGMAAAIAAARQGARVLLLEKLPSPGAKLKATGGGRCNLASNLSNAEIMRRFGRDGRFMTPALQACDCSRLIEFMTEIGVECHVPDGMRVFPKDHNAGTVLSALEAEIKRLNIELHCSQTIDALVIEAGIIKGVNCNNKLFLAESVILATGGRGYPTLGSDGSGLKLAATAGHTVTELFPAMLPLQTRETWVKNCRADTIGKAEIRIDLPEAKKLQARGDLIFTSDGIRGPVVLDFAREITPLLARYGEVPLLVNLVKGMNEEELRKHIDNRRKAEPKLTVAQALSGLLPEPLAAELCRQAGLDLAKPLKDQPGSSRDRLLKLLVATPLTVIGHAGWEAAMVTRGGVSLKEIRPETLESRLIRGLYFCGEIVNLDGPCGGYNLHWCFASGLLAGQRAANSAAIAGQSLSVTESSSIRK